MLCIRISFAALLGGQLLTGREFRFSCIITSVKHLFCAIVAQFTNLEFWTCPIVPLENPYTYLINNAAFWQRNRKKCTTLFFSYYFTIKGFKNKILYKNPCIFPPFSYIYYIFSLVNKNNKKLRK